MIHENTSILVTGGTGSFGRALVSTLLERFPSIRRLVVFSRDELKQFELSQDFPPSSYPGLRYFLGDVRDADRLRRAMDGIEVVIHAAALKQVPAAEYNPFEAVKTNVIGAQNVIEAALDTDVRSVIALSTDKAAAPVNLYGATKLCSDKLFIAANGIKGNRSLRFSVVRYGNVLGSRGSVAPLFIDKRASGVLPVTEPEMTRFTITLGQSVQFVLDSIARADGGEIFVPKIPSYRLRDLAEAISPRCRLEITGLRTGEKLHEELVTRSDSVNTLEFDDHYVIYPDPSALARGETQGGRRMPQGFAFSSDANPERLTVEQLRRLISSELGVDLSA